MTFHERHIGFDMETDGTRPEYALQPWRVAQKHAWATSLVWGRSAELEGETYPRREAMEAMLRYALDNDLRIVGWNVQFDIQWLIAYGLEELAMRAKWLDAMLVWKHATVEPEHDAKPGKRKSRSLKAFVPEHFPEHAGYEADITYHDPTAAQLEALHAYNIRDVDFTLTGAAMYWAKLTPKQRRCVLIEAECLPLVAAANLRGMLIDTLTLRSLRADLERVARMKLAKLERFGVDATVVRSPDRLRQKMFVEWGLPPLKETPASKPGAIKYSTDKETLHELAISTGDWRVKCIRTYRETLNAIDKFVDSPLEAADYCGDGCAHPQFHVFSTYCVPGDVEVMTRAGWVRLDRWQGGEIVQVRPDLSMEFLPATLFVGPTVDRWVRFKQRSLDCLFTHGHTIPFINQDTMRWETRQAGDMGASHRLIPVAGRLKLEGKFTIDQMKLFAAVQADGSYVSKKYKGVAYRPALKFTLKKERKIIRIKSILDRLNVPYRESVCSAYPGRTEIIVAMSNVPEWCERDKKFFGPWLLDTSSEGLTAFVAELQFWDGSAHADGGFKYGSNIEANTEWVVTCAALTARKAAMHRLSNGMWECHISEVAIRACRAVGPRYYSEVSETRRAYCAETQTGFWLARSNGHIFVTGNTGRFTVSSKQKYNLKQRNKVETEEVE